MYTDAARTGRKGYLKAAMLCAFIVMKCEGFSQITDLVDYLENNRLIAYYCGFDITKELPSYWTFVRFLKKLDNGLLKQVMRQQVMKLVKLGVVDTSFIGLDSTPVMANTKLN
jgi:transposase